MRIGMNIYEIAQKANVSRATVSRVINHMSGVKEETRRRVEQVISEVNYIPSAAARSLVSKKSNTIGVLIYNITQPFWAGITSGIENGALQNDYGMFIFNSKSHSTNWDYQKAYKQNLRKLVRQGVDGIIIALLNDLDPDDIAFLESVHMPFTVLQNHLENSPIVSVNVDNVKSAFEATNYLIRLGHRSIVHVTGPMTSGIAQKRVEGFTKAMTAAGLPVASDSLINGTFNFNDGYWAMKRILMRENLPTAVLFGCDTEAFGGIAAAREMNVHVPEDISVMGFDGLAREIEYGALLPDLTTMCQPMEQLGGSAVQQLLKLIGGTRPDPSELYLDMTLNEGKTCCRPQ
jgi:LacI family transcriptional regulator